MRKFDHLIVESNDDITLVRLNRPDQKNALNAALISELTDVARALKADPELRAVILTGTDGFFSAGADLSMLDTADQANPLALREVLRAGPDMCRAWEEIEAVTLAAIEGFCVGGACSLVLACDFRIGADTTMMRLPEVPLGMNMSWQTLPRLTTLIGPSRAKQFAIFGERTQADTLLNWGLIDRQVETGQALSEARIWGENIAALPPLPVRMTKESINAAANSGHHAVSHMDRDQFLLTALSGYIKSKGSRRG